MSLFSFLLISNSAAAQVVDLDECDQSMECGDCTLYWYCEQVGEVPYYPCALHIHCPNGGYHTAIVTSINDQANPCGNSQSPAVWSDFYWIQNFPSNNDPIVFSWDDDPICQTVEVRLKHELGGNQTTCQVFLNCF